MVRKKRGSVVVLVAIVFCLFIPQILAECYIFPDGDERFYCQDGISIDDARNECGEFESCVENVHIVSGQCSEIKECEQILCNVDCSETTVEKCSLKGLEVSNGDLEGKPVLDSEQQKWCTPQCCKAGPYCSNGNVFRYDCELNALRSGINSNDIVSVFDQTTDQCITNTCNIVLDKGSLKVIVSGKDGFIPNVEVFADSIKLTTDQNGEALFENLNPRSYIVKANVINYATQTKEVIVKPAEETEISFLLSKEGTLQVSGTVTDNNNQPINQATVSWSGGFTLTDNKGGYIATGLSAQEYIFTASKSGHIQDTAQIILTESTIQDFSLSQTQTQGVRGITYVDSLPQFGVTLFVKKDGGNFVRKSFSRPPNANYEIELESGTYDIKAVFQEYDVVKTITVSNEFVNLDLFLSRLIPECGPENLKPVPILNGNPTQGEAILELHWTKPCPEVVSYEIQKFHGEDTLTPFSVSGIQTRYQDSKVQWGESYQYKIKTIYKNGLESIETVSPIIYVGDVECKGKTSHTQTFCSSAEKSKIFACDDENRKSTARDCSSRGVSWFCALDENQAKCKDDGACNVFSQSADPFGLYYSRNNCYYNQENELSTPSNYCVYDYTDSPVNSCNSCSNIDSCFGYKSEDACGVNSCLSTACKWVGDAEAKLVDYSNIFPNLPPYATLETGTGYCVEQDYEISVSDPEGDDFCSLCGPESTLFENNFCTAEVCSNLGRCLSTPELNECEQCGEIPTQGSSCYDFQTEYECVNDQGIEITDGVILGSNDRCGWEKCSWIGSCVKDGDADLVDDCSLRPGEDKDCKYDIFPPHTSVIEEGKIISLASPELTFEAEDNLYLGDLHFCLVEVGENSQDHCTEEVFKNNKVEYTLFANKETISVNILDSLGKDEIGKTYKVKYYSKDRYFNQESLQDSFVYVDNVVPHFELEGTSETRGDRTDLTLVILGEREPMECEFTLNPVLPKANSQTKIVDRLNRKKSVTFENLPGIQYEVNVTCNDDAGNTNERIKFFTFDLEPDIDIIFPKVGGAVASTSIGFEVHTDIGTVCELRTIADDNKVVDFTPDADFKIHKTPQVPGFIEQPYFDIYKVVCKEILQEESHEDYFSFAVDFTAPTLQIVLSEGERNEVRPNNYNWEEFFVESANVNFECDQQDLGFSCDKQMVCLGEGCENRNDERYVEFSDSLTVEESTRICYYSIDEAGNSHQPFCGNIKVEGYGFILEKPDQYFFNNEIWGVSNKTPFIWQFYTKVPTEECHFSFSSGFDYNDVPSIRILQKNSAGKYVLQNFPQDLDTSEFGDGGIKEVYVLCQNSVGELGPEQKMNLVYDPSVPQILDAFADPKTVVEGVTTNLFVETDDPTVCKFDEESEDFETMKYTLSEENVVSQNHEGQYSISFVGLQKDYSLKTQCSNGDGLSEIENIDFSVDYSILGNIVSVFPNGESFTNSNVLVRVETNKNGACKIKDNETLIPMNGSATKIHTYELTNLVENDYQYLVQCSIAGHHPPAVEVKFRIDRTSPIITLVDDGNYTCGNNEQEVAVYTNEVNISLYQFEVYDKGVEKNTTERISRIRRETETTISTGRLIFNGTIDYESPIKIPTSQLNESRKYSVRVRSGDAAGNWGSFIESDGFVVSNSNHTACEADKKAPQFSLKSNQTCFSMAVEVHCSDETGCSNRKYGKSISSSSCRATKTYSGGKIVYEESGWLCFSANDAVGKNSSQIFQINFNDDDGDGVANEDGEGNICDLCDNTLSGKEVDGEGCAIGQVPGNRPDADNDGLPDVWEKTYDSEECPFNYLVADSNNNGINDGAEDYDSDGLSNFDEFAGGYNPCLNDAPPAKKDPPKKPIATPGPSPENQPNYVAWILLVMGILFVGGGIGYLIYFYKSGTKSKPTSIVSGSRKVDSRQTLETSKLQNKLFQFRRSRQEKLMKRKRQSLFGKFNQKSLPKVTKLQDVNSLPGIQKITKPAKSSKPIKPVKSSKPAKSNDIFSKLDDISKKTKQNKKPNSKDSIFDKLKKISKKK